MSCKSDCKCASGNVFTKKKHKKWWKFKKHGKNDCRKNIFSR